MNQLKPDHLKALVLENLHLPFLRDFALGLAGIYQASYDSVGSRYPVTWKEVQPYDRRAAVEQHLWHIGGDHGIEMTQQPNVAGNCWHIEARRGPIVLTTHAVAGPWEMVREARYRETLAEPNYEIPFGPEFYRPRRNVYYGMLLHGPEPDDQSRAAFACLGFPSSDLRTYVIHFDIEELCGVKLYPAAERPNDDEPTPQALRRKLTAGLK